MSEPKAKVKKKIRPLESPFVRRVMSDLKRLTPFVRKNEAGAVSGWPDVDACIKGKWVSVECKRDKNARPTKLQEYRIAQIKIAGGFAAVVYPENWGEVYAQICKLCEEDENV